MHRTHRSYLDFLEDFSHLTHDPSCFEEYSIRYNSSRAFPTSKLILMISNQLFVGVDKPLQKVCQAHYIMGTSLLLIISHLLVVLLHHVLLDHFLDFDDHFLVLLAVALVQALQLTIRYKALPVGEEERLEDDVLEEVP